MKQYLIRLDDASDYMDVEKWRRMEALLDKYDIKPIFGIIPDNKDESLIGTYQRNPEFWNLIHGWIDKRWVPAMHGCHHQYITTDGGINPIHKRSEFAGLPFEEQAQKIRLGYHILLEKDIRPEIFFAPSHTFDKNTLRALEAETAIRVISDTIATDVYKDGAFWFIPQQSGKVRKLPFKTVTFCYHPNSMQPKDYNELENFIKSNKRFFSYFEKKETTRRKNLIDEIVSIIYFSKKIIKRA